MARLGDVNSFLCFDCETTGVDTDIDRIITASLVVRSKNEEDLVTAIILNPGVPIPEGATSIHGILDKDVIENGKDPFEELPFVYSMLQQAWEDRIPVVGSNLPYDFSILAAELDRYGLEPFKVTGPVLDTMVLHRMVSNQRKANMKAMTAYYGIVNKTAHNSTSDCIATLDILEKMIAGSAYLQETDLRDLYRDQRVSHRNWAINMQSFFDSIGKSDQVNPFWPVDRKWEINE